jgi:hypothetical protein
MKGIRTRSLPAIRLTLVIAVGLLSGCEKKEIDPQSAAIPIVSIAATNQPVPSGTENLPFAKLAGKWLRPDGGYILEIRSVDGASGKLEAAYLNPRPINVSKAQAARDGGNLKVFIELRDVNYPGSTYTLTYDPASDQLKGDYFQAALKQAFDVFFTRVKP